MHTPTMALAWEFWRRHRNRLFLMAAFLLFFATVYPTLCARAGLDLGAADFTDSVAPRFMPANGAPTPQDVGRILYILFLAAGPATAMFSTMACLVWMFTFTAPSPDTKDVFAFPMRIFNLPVSTPGLFWRFFLGGQLVMVLGRAAWIHLVRLPQMEVFKHYGSGFDWMTFMALMQGLIWALAGSPNLRMLLVLATLFGFMVAPHEDFPGSVFFHSTACLPTLSALGAVLSWVGLGKMRHGQWQGWDWEQIPAKFGARGTMKGPKKFSSPEQAQLWFEWHRDSRRLCRFTALVALTPVATLALARVSGFHNGPVDPETLCVLVGGLLALPVFLHFCFLMAGTKPDLQFILARPLTNGQLMMAALKSSGISTVVSFGIAALGIGGVACLADIRQVNAVWKLQPQYWLAIIPAVLLVAWRLTPASLCFLWSGQRQVQRAPVWAFFGIYFCVFLVGVLDANEEYRKFFLRIIPASLVCLVILKFTFAVFSFRTSIKRGLLSRSAAWIYLAAWSLIAAAVMLPVILIVQDTTWIFYLCLIIVLLTPLFRVGLCPILLARNRHA